MGKALLSNTAIHVDVFSMRRYVYNVQAMNPEERKKVEDHMAKCSQCKRGYDLYLERKDLYLQMRNIDCDT
jgi:hypothetical protein